MADAGSGTASVNEPRVGIIIGKQQSPKMGPRSFGIGPADHHELLAVQAFHFQSLAAIAGRVRRVGPLRDDAFQLQPARLLIEGPAAPDLMVAELQRR